MSDLNSPSFACHDRVAMVLRLSLVQAVRIDGKCEPPDQIIRRFGQLDVEQAYHEVLGRNLLGTPVSLKHKLER